MQPPGTNQPGLQGKAYLDIFVWPIDHDQLLTRDDWLGHIPAQLCIVVGKEADPVGAPVALLGMPAHLCAVPAAKGGADKLISSLYP
jgi:hypothetical protein